MSNGHRACPRKVEARANDERYRDRLTARTAA